MSNLTMHDQATLDHTRAFVETLPPNERRASEGILHVAEVLNEEARQAAEAERRASGGAVATHEVDETVEQITNETIEDLRAVTNDDGVAFHGTVPAETAIDGSGGENIGVANVVTASDASNNVDASFDNINANFDVNFDANFDNGAFANLDNGAITNFASGYSNIEFGALLATAAPYQQTASEAVEATRAVEIVDEESESVSEQPSVGSGVISPSTAQTTPPAPSDSPDMSDAVKPAAAPASQPNGQEWWQKTANALPWNVGRTELTGTLPNNAHFAMAQAAYRGPFPCKKLLPAHSQPATTATPIVAGTSAGEYQSPHRPPCRQRPGHAAGHRTLNQFSSGGQTMMNKAPGSMPSRMPVPISTGMPPTTTTAMAATAPTGIPTTAPVSAPQIAVNYGTMNFQGGGGGRQQQHTHMAHNVPLTGVRNQQWVDSRALNAPQTGYPSPGFNGFNDVPFMGQFQHNTQPASLVPPGQAQFSISSQGMAHGFQQQPFSIAELSFRYQWIQGQLEQQQMKMEQQQMTMERQQMQLNALMKSKMPSAGQGNLTPTRPTCNHKKRPSTQEPATGMTQPPAKKAKLQRPPAESNVPAKSRSPRHTHKHTHKHKHTSA